MRKSLYILALLEKFIRILRVHLGVLKENAEVHRCVHILAFLEKFSKMENAELRM